MPTDDRDPLPVLEDWVAVLAEELQLTDLEVDLEMLLGVAADAAHTVIRPAAPITTFLLGYAAARSREPADLGPALAAIERALRRHADRTD